MTFQRCRYMDWMIRQATDIELHPNNMNREDSLCLIQSWETPHPLSQRTYNTSPKE
jgi:hypothetical protein